MRFLSAGSPPRPAAGATIVAESLDGGLFRATCDAQGAFRLAELPPGSYAVTALGDSGEQADLRVEVVAGVDATPIALTLEAISGETIVVRGVSAADERRQSADSVTVIETERAKRETADLGEVLARTQGVAVRKDGSLGSTARVSLAGFTGDQVRFFLDGIPLELAGYPFGIANIPVNLVDRIEVYSGVVPVRFGADALGGGINLVTQQGLRVGLHGAASYEVGSFGTHRVTGSGRYLHDETGLYLRADGFFDLARNDYSVDVEIPDEFGRLTERSVDRFHDGYLAGGGVLEAGVTDKRWAKRLSIRAFASAYDKEYQHNQSMTRVYGDVTYEESSIGASARYEQPLADFLSLEAIAGYTFTRGVFRDVSPCVYSWLGECIMEGAPGEIEVFPHHQVSWEHAAFARANFEAKLRPGHLARLSLSPTYATRSGDERLDQMGGFDALAAERELFTMVSGAEYQVDLLSDRLQNIAFAKYYAQRLSAEEAASGDAFLRRDRSTHDFGVGDGVRVRLTDWLYAKASYEYATRLPRPDEVFGDNAFITPNLTLQPERSHNLNVGVAVEELSTPIGSLGGTASGFLREAEQLIVLLGNENDQSYQNVYGARSLGVEAAAQWRCPCDLLSLEGSATYLSFRNNSSEGLFGLFEGDRIPNTPYLFASGSARLTLRELFAKRDELMVHATSRYVHEFFRSWESVGQRDSKQVIDAQLVHSAGLVYLSRGERVHWSATLEVANLTDADVFDYYGLQRPGRSISIKTAVEL